MRVKWKSSMGMKQDITKQNPAVEFHTAITRKDITRLEFLMAETHYMIDKAGRKVEGKAACLKAWRMFFDQFPDYHHEIEGVETDERYTKIVGYALSDNPALNGPASWFARIENGKLLNWEIL